MIIIPRLELRPSCLAVPQVQQVAVVPIPLLFMNTLCSISGAANVSGTLLIDPGFPRSLAIFARVEVHGVSIGPAVISLVDTHFAVPTRFDVRRIRSVGLCPQLRWSNHQSADQYRTKNRKKRIRRSPLV